ncbi:movement protein [Sesamum angolense]|uniref:Movement protein n=1 Tax=Sesamum angolense TaxID=2727404 RepID=A0AAE1X9M0_9LAMI|nr:movement protein [Sesamum angolense]
MIGNLYAGKLMFDIHPRIAYNLAYQDFSRVLTLHQDFKRNDLMKEGNRPYSITYRIAYAISNTHHSDLFLRKEYIEISRLFKEFTKVMAPDPIRIPRIGGVDIIIKDHPVLDRTISSRTEFSSRISFSEDRIMGYKGKEKELLKVLTPQEIRDQEFAQQNLEFSLKKQGKPYLLLQEGIFTKIPNTHKRGDFDAKLTHPKMPDKRKFGKVLLSFMQQELIDSDSFYEESEEEIKNLKEASQELETMDISEKSKLSLKMSRSSSRETSMNMEDKKDMQMIIKEHINLGLIEPGISAYSSPGFLVRNHGIFMKDLAKYRKDLRPLLKDTESAKWKWEEIHTQRVRELKQVCNNLPKLAIPQDEDELVVYTDANDYRWAVVLMKKTTTGEEPCRYTGGLFTEQQAQVWHINEKELFAVWKAFKR